MGYAATGIGRDVDERLARAGKAASDLSDIIKQQPRELVALLRIINGLSAEDVLKLARQARRAQDK
ncbi:MAG: hypothetical protein H2045_05835 [Rhizobiales bacterium]|nr:hypothetical protein [Hyphomicrobiales bacterium]